MRKTKLDVVITTQFKKDYKLAIKRNLKIDLLEKERLQWNQHQQI